MARFFNRNKENNDYAKFEGGSTSTMVTASQRRTSSRRFRFKNPFAKWGIFKFIRDTLTNPEIMSKVGVTLLVVIIYRALSAVPLPGINMDVYIELFGNTNISQSQYLFTVFTGGRLETPSIIGLGLAAYINASIIMQLLPYAIPRLKELQKEGERGKQIINQITRYITLPISFVYAAAYVLLISQTDFSTNAGGIIPSSTPVHIIPHAPGSDWPTIAKVVFMALILAGGTMLLMWLSELVTEKGLGNGSSLIIALGILSSLPALIQNDFAKLNIRQVLSQLSQGNTLALSDPTLLAILGSIIGFILLIAAIVFINESQRKLPIQYARRVRGTEGGQSSFLPIKFTVTGVMPVIFAYALLSMPQLIVPLIERVAGETEIIRSIEQGFLFSQASNIVSDGVAVDQAAVLDARDTTYDIVYFFLVILFGIVYSFIVLNPKETAENLQKSGAFVPGIRPGKSTEKYFTKVLLRIAFVGALFLALIAIVPIIGRNAVFTATDGQQLALLSGIGGTSILILVGVLLDTKRQFDSLRSTRNYQRYINN